MANTEIPDSGAADPNAVPEELLLGNPFAVVHDVELRERSGAACPSCQQPAVGGSTSILECDCGQLFRIDLLSGDVAQCPGCDLKYTHGLIVCAPDNPDAFLEALAVVLRANGYQVAAPDDDDDEDPGELGGDEDNDDYIDEEGAAVEDDVDDLPDDADNDPDDLPDGKE